MTAKDVKIFKLKARGDAGNCKTELLIAFGRIAQSFGMETALSMDGHDMLITSTKTQRCALYEFNRSSVETISAATSGLIATGDEGAELSVMGDSA